MEHERLPKAGEPNVSEFYEGLTDDDFLGICTNIFLFYLKDDYISKLRRLLTIEQYSHPQLGETFRQFFINRVLDKQKEVLQQFIDSGRFIPCDAYTMALQFYSPVFLLLYKYDNFPEDEEQAIAELKMHARQFNQVYKKAENHREA